MALSKLKMRERGGELPLGRKLEAPLKEEFGGRQTERRYPTTVDLLEISRYSR